MAFSERHEFAASRYGVPLYAEQYEAFEARPSPGAANSPGRTPATFAVLLVDAVQSARWQTGR